MAVVASFVGTPLNNIPPSVVVVFTDTSTGSPDSWIWDFGDGEYSYDQNPTHTYTGIDGNKWTVTLTAWIADTPTTFGVSSTSDQTKIGPFESSNALGYSEYDAVGWSGNTPNVVSFLGIDSTGSFGYLGARTTRTYVFPSVDSVTVAFLVEAQRLETDITLNRTVGHQDASFGIYLGGSRVATMSGVGDYNTWQPMYNATVFASTTKSYWQWPDEGQLALIESPNTWHGVIGQSRIQHLKATSGDNVDSTTKVEYVSLNIEKEDIYIDFVGTPLSGTSSLAVQFTDLSNIAHGTSVWEFGDGNSVTYAGETHPSNTYTTDGCSIDLL